MPRDPDSVTYDPWARRLLAELAADPWEWHGRAVDGAQAGDHGPDHLTDTQRSVQRSLYWCLEHAASSGALIRPRWSLHLAWGPPARRRLLSARVVPKAAGRAWYADKNASV
jgi:hypothetical protein